MTGEDWDIDRYLLEVANVRNIMDSWTPEEVSLGAIRELIAYFPLKHRTITFTLLQGGYRAHDLKKYELDLKNVRAEARVTVANKKLDREWERERTAFWVGVALLVFAFVASAAMSNINASASLPLRVMAGAGVALLVGGLPGFLSIDTSVKMGKSKVAIRASGGIAGFVMVYLFDPGWVSSLLRISK